MTLIDLGAYKFFFEKEKRVLYAKRQFPIDFSVWGVIGHMFVGMMSRIEGISAHGATIWQIQHVMVVLKLTKKNAKYARGRFFYFSCTQCLCWKNYN